MSSNSMQTNSAQDEQHEVTLDDALALAQGHHREGNYILAERTYRDILRAVPDHFPTTQNLGVLLFHSGNLNEARHYLEIAVKTEPEDAGAINNYAGVMAQMGEHEQALPLYDKALAINPESIDALNNKAFALWSLNRYREAEETSRAALKIDPENLIALNGLGMALVKRSKYGEAVDAWEDAAQINPESAMIWANLGNALREMGRLGEALEKCQKAIELDPKNPEALCNLANVLRDQGETDEALEFYERATNERPEYHEAHSNKAIAYLDKSLFEPAVIAARYAIAFQPEYVDAYRPLCTGLNELGEFEQAHVFSQRAIHFEPDNAEPYLDLADILARLDQYDDAEAAIQEALKRSPDNARAFMKLSEVRERTDNFEGAIQAVEDGLKLSPDMVSLHVRRAMVHFFEGNPEDGLEHVDKALKINPGYLAGLQHKAEILVSLNRNEEALEVVEKALEINKETPGLYSSLISLKKFKSEDDPHFKDMKAIEDIIHEYGQSANAVYFYAMSEAYEQMKKFDLAFEYLQKANEVKRKSIPDGEWQKFLNPKAIKANYTPDLLEKFVGTGYDSDSPVFIVGMPRSGTTLTEQIISSHPDVFGAGELREISTLQTIPRFLQEGDTKRLGEEYIEAVKAKDLTGKAKRITDKMPANYSQIGFIACALPNAKIIHCRRNPVDTLLSCYKQNFARGQYWSYTLDDLASEYESYLEIMEYWRSVLPGRFLEIDYEETVGNFEEQARKLIDYVGLEWDDACLEPHKQKRAVLTASKAQVTKPVYKTSVEKWKRYEEHLQPLADRLMPLYEKSKA